MSQLWFAGVRECPPWFSIVGATVTVNQFFCILHDSQFKNTYVTTIWHVLSLICIPLSRKILSTRSTSRWLGRAVWGADSPVVEWRGVGSNPAGNIFILIFSLPPPSEKLSGTHANEIKHDHLPVVIVVLDPRCNLSYNQGLVYS